MGQFHQYHRLKGQHRKVLTNLMLHLNTQKIHTIGFSLLVGSPSPKCKARSQIDLVSDLTEIGSP